MDLFLRQMGEIDKQGLTDLWRMEMRLIDTLFAMERKGIRIDTSALCGAICTE